MYVCMYALFNVKYFLVTAQMHEEVAMNLLFLKRKLEEVKIYAYLLIRCIHTYIHILCTRIKIFENRKTTNPKCGIAALIYLCYLQ
jgi:hypothetical protein